MEKKSEKNLIRETIKNKARFRRILKKTALAFCLAVVFGVTASLAFVLSRPIWEDINTEEPTSVAITIFRESTTAAEVTTEETTAEPETESTMAATADGTISQELREYVNDKIDSAVTAENIYVELRRTAAQAAGSLVTITMEEQGSWLDRQVPVSSEGSGVVIALTESEMLILTASDAITGSEHIYVSLSAGSAEARVKGSDSIFGLTVLSVPTEVMTEVDKTITPITMGNASLVSQGSPVIALGKPTGVNGSVMYGMVAYMESGVSIVDGSVRLLQTDMAAVTGSRGILVNDEGELVGIITEQYSDYLGQGYVTALGLYELQSSIEKMSNGQAGAMLGIKGQTVTRTLCEKQGIPMGVYVTEAVTGEPAEEAGIIAGDVITAINDKEIASCAGLSSVINGCEPGTEVQISIKRNNRGTWKDLVLAVTFGSR